LAVCSQQPREPQEPSCREKEFREKKGKKNNQAAQAIDQSKFFSGGINQGQAGERCSLGRPESN
jgi:hypothetical protein